MLKIECVVVRYVNEKITYKKIISILLWMIHCVIPLFVIKHHSLIHEKVNNWMTCNKGYSVLVRNNSRNIRWNDAN